MWAAEAPGARVCWRRVGADRVVLDGTKAWCSGAAQLSHGLLTVWPADGPTDRPWLAAVGMRQPGVSFDPSAWSAVGMAGSESIDVQFDHVPARLIGGPGDYLTRPGFWQGGGGVAACWHGGAAAVAADLRAAVKPGDGWHRLLALGEVDVALTANATLLREAASWIDDHPGDDARLWALRARESTEGGGRAGARSRRPRDGRGAVLP